MKKNRLLVIIIAIFCIGIFVSLFSGREDASSQAGIGVTGLSHQPSEEELVKYGPIVANINGKCDIDDEASYISCIDSQLKRLSLENGPRYALDVAVALAQKQSVINEYSHDLAHTIGAAALDRSYDRADDYSRLTDAMGQALVECYSWGVMGCMHGVIEASIVHIPIEERTDMIRRTCMENSLIQSHQVYINHCLHWAGHGMAIFTDQTLEESLSICEELDDEFGSDNVSLCISGVFHAGTLPRDENGEYFENVQRIYDENDPYYPCQDIPERYRKQCYNSTPGRLRTQEIGEIFDACYDIPELDKMKKYEYVRACYDAAANALSMRVAQDAQVIVDACAEHSHPDYLGYCYAGALRYWFLRDPRMENVGSSDICRLAEREHKSLCYTALGSVIHESFYSQDMQVEYCSEMAEDEYITECITLMEY